MIKNKQTVKGILPIVGMLIISMSLSGCKKPVETDVGAETKGITQAVGEAADNESVTEIKTIEPPEDGWTLEELLSVTYIYDHQLENPCTLNTLGDNFSFDISTFKFFEEDNSSVVTLKYNDTFIANANLKNCNCQDDICADTVIDGYTFNTLSINNNTNAVIVNGITLLSSKEKVIKQLGKPNISEEFSKTSYIEYHKSGTDEILLAFGFNEKDEMTSFRLTY